VSLKTYSEKLLQLKNRNQRILILGCGLSGFAAARLCLRAGISCEIWDQAEYNNLSTSAETAASIEDLKSKGVEFRLGHDPKIYQPDFGLLIISPGIPPWSELLQNNQIADLEKLSELELGLEIIRECSKCRQIVVTGSNGKSTTASLIQHILVSSGFRSILVGNIGKSALDLISGELKLFNELDYLVVEASSYQLEAFKVYRPDVALMLNLAENHLERHKTMAAYAEAKRNLINRSQSADYLIMPAEGDWCSSFESGFKGKTLRFGKDTDSDAVLDNQKLTCTLADKISYLISEGKLLGEHNLRNIAAAALGCQSMGLSSEKIFEACRSFRSLEHRLEIIDLPNGAVICNDSKATTVDASIAACKAILSANTGRQIILMLGGEQKKGSNWKALKDLLVRYKDNFAKIELFGVDANVLAQELVDIEIEVSISKTLRECLLRLKPELAADSLVLLSPGCASFDEFDNFEHRGRVFKQLMIVVS
jgi:UDP-N-acetylmuramoylalanine--D-glutamate ligase